MIRNQVRRIMYGAILLMIALLSLKKLGKTFATGSFTEDNKEVHTVLV